MDIKSKYKGLNTLCILTSGILIIAIVYKLIGFGCNTAPGVLLSMIGLVVTIGLSVRMINCYESIKYIKLEETMESSIPGLITQNVIVVIATTLMLI